MLPHVARHFQPSELLYSLNITCPYTNETQKAEKSSKRKVIFQLGLLTLVESMNIFSFN